MTWLWSIAHFIDGLTRRLGQATSWLALLMVVIGAGNAVLRYLGRFVGTNLSSNAALELQWYLFSALFLLGAAWTLQQDRHVRVDVFYGRLSARGQALVDLLGTLLFLFPFCGLAIWVTNPSVLESWRLLEVSPDPGGLPRYPVKTLLLVCFYTVLVQGLSQLCKHTAVLLGVPDPRAVAPVASEGADG